MSNKLTRIMYIEDKSGGLEGAARIGRVTFSKSGRSLMYVGREFGRIKYGFKANYIETETGDLFWISGPKARGGDRLYGGNCVEIDDDVRVEYWTEIRSQPARRDETSY
jgi:hypothetical protein